MFENKFWKKMLETKYFEKKSVRHYFCFASTLRRVQKKDSDSPGSDGKKL